VYENLYGTLGAERLDYLFARLMWLISNMLRGEGDVTPIDAFMPYAAQDKPAEVKRKKHPNTTWFEQAWAEMGGADEAAQMADEMYEDTE